MTPRRFAVFIVVMLIPALLWGFAAFGKDDLILATRSLMGQAKKTRPGLFDAFCERYRVPNRSQHQQDMALERLWTVFKQCTPEKAEYGDQTPVTTADGTERPHRQVRVRGRIDSGESVEFSVDWVMYAGEWRIGGFGGWQPPQQVQYRPY